MRIFIVFFVVVVLIVVLFVVDEVFVNVEVVFVVVAGSGVE